MGATRTQIYLTAEQRAHIDRLAQETGQSLAEIVRTALDRYLGLRTAERDQALSTTFGATPDLDVPPRSEPDRHEW